MELLLILTPILISDIINPVIFTGTVYGLGSRRPFASTIAILFGFFITYFFSGVVIAFTFERIDDFLNDTGTVFYILEFIIACLLLFFAWYIYRTTDYQHEPKLSKPEHLGLWKALLMGVQINFVGLPFALPYFAAIDQILKEDFTDTVNVLILLAYNLLYILPFAMMMLVRLVYKKESDKIFHKINVWLLRTSDVVLPIILIVLALFMFEDFANWQLGYRST